MSLKWNAVAQTVYQTCLRLDQEDFDGYLELFAPEFHYWITAYSPEIRKEMIWLSHDRDGLAALLENVPDHVRRLGSLHRHATVYTVEPGENGTVRVTSSIQVTHTDPDGSSRLFAVGHYHDVLVDTADGPRLTERNAKLETRELGIGSHLPI
jgi:methanesulfonate monooxygenase small subunit